LGNDRLNKNIAFEPLYIISQFQTAMQKFVFTKEEMARDLERTGLRKGDTVLVHSSLSRIGYVPGGAETVIDALLEAVGDAGTIVVPTLTGHMSDSPENPPAFSSDKPSWTGTIPEVLRKREGACRSNHPTHSVAAIGNLARKMTEGHEDAMTPCGRDTPYLKIAEAHGKILFLGATLNSNTTFHSIEELAKLYYHLQPEPTICELEIGGKPIKRRMFLHAYGAPRTFGEKEGELVESGVAKVGHVGRAKSTLMDAGGMIDFILQKLKGDGLYLVEREVIDFWCISGCIDLVSQGKFDSMKINLYLPKGASVKFLGNSLLFKGVQMDFHDNLKLKSGTLKLPSKFAKVLRLNGGYSYWMRFKRGAKGMEADVVDHARPYSAAKII